jgi:ubiquinone/menaquinone biosynthesis C-methylase UbiE
LIKQGNKKVRKMSKPKNFWDNASNNYDKTEERFEYIHQKSRKNTRKHLESSNVVLDYGCGTGTTACEIANDVKEIYAIDISSKMVEISKEKAAKKNIKNVTFTEGDIFDEKLKKNLLIEFWLLICCILSLIPRMLCKE